MRRAAIVGSFCGGQRILAHADDTRPHRLRRLIWHFQNGPRLALKHGAANTNRDSRPRPRLKTKMGVNPVCEREASRWRRWLVSLQELIVFASFNGAIFGWFLIRWAMQ